jgi:hypothetical protein
MARIKKRLFFTPADATAETVFTNTAGQITTLESMTMAKPSASVAADIRLSIGTDAAGTRVIEYPLPAGTQFAVIYPGIVLSGTETLQLSAVGSDDVVICTGSGSVELVA